MRWWHALILAFGLVIGGALSGGVYTLMSLEGDLTRFNRFTGAFDIYSLKTGDLGWVRFPNTYEHGTTESLRRIRKDFDEVTPPTRP